MLGRLFPNKLCVIVTLLSLYLTSGTGHAACADGPIAIILSDTEESYTSPVATFTDEVGMAVETFNLHGDIDNAPQVMAAVFARKPSLLFTLGAKASYVAKVWTSDHQETPVIFALVLNWQRYNFLDGQDNIAGIASEVAPGTQLANLTLFSPSIETIGVIYSAEHSSQTLRSAQKAAKILDLKLVAKAITRPGDFRRTYRKMSSRIDGFWILTDPVVYTIDNISWLENKCIKDRLLCIGQSGNIAKLGMLLALDPDTHNIGSQAASMAKNIIQKHKKPKEIGVMPPLGTRLILNMKTAGKIGLSISKSALDITNEVID